MESLLGAQPPSFSTSRTSQQWTGGTVHLRFQNFDFALGRHAASSTVGASAHVSPSDGPLYHMVSTMMYNLSCAYRI